MATFIWLLSKESSLDTEPKLLQAPFGDGYGLTVGDGINNMPRTWTARLAKRTTAEANAIEAFLRARGGSEAFDWTDPNGTVARWTCKRWSRTEHGGGIASITATFVEAFGL